MSYAYFWGKGTQFLDFIVILRPTEAGLGDRLFFVQLQILKPCPTQQSIIG